jgi:hypothetical protein
MMRALWVPDDVAGGALVGTLLAPLPKRVRPLTLDEKATRSPLSKTRGSRGTTLAQRRLARCGSTPDARPAALASSMTRGCAAG